MSSVDKNAAASASPIDECTATTLLKLMNKTDKEMGTLHTSIWKQFPFQFQRVHSIFLLFYEFRGEKA